MHLLLKNILVMKKLILAGLILSFSLSCKAQKTQPMEIKKNDTSDQKIKMSLSPEQRYILHQIIIKNSATRPQQNTEFYVYDLKKDTIIYQHATIRGKVSWQNEHVLKIWTVPGMVKHDHKSTDDIYYLDIRNGKKMKEISDSMKQGEI